jgi:hypothetical protein
MSDTAKAEKLFDEVSDWFAAQVPGALGDARREDDICLAAVQRYAEAKRLVDPEGAFENVTHFFCADGIGYEQPRVPALKRVSSLGAKDAQRLAQKLGDIAMRLESASFKN